MYLSEHINVCTNLVEMRQIAIEGLSVVVEIECEYILMFIYIYIYIKECIHGTLSRYAGLRNVEATMMSRHL